MKEKFPNPPLEAQWLIDTRNAYYDSMVYRWCQLFGSNREPTHYKKLWLLHEKLNKLGIETKKMLKARLLSQANVSIEEFDEYHKKTISYRNKYLIHRVNDPEKINNNDLSYPFVVILEKTTSSLFLILKDILVTYPKTKDNCNDEQGVRYCECQMSLIDFVKNSIPKMIFD